MTTKISRIIGHYETKRGNTLVVNIIGKGLHGKDTRYLFVVKTGEKTILEKQLDLVSPNWFIEYFCENY